MKIYKLAFIFIILNSLILETKAQDSYKNFITAEAECIELFSTGKNHNSFLFLFKIKNPLIGNAGDTVVLSQEIFSDFGGKQIREKLRLGNTVILKFTTDWNKEDSSAYIPEEIVKKTIKYKKVSLIWVCEPDRQASFSRLAEKLPKTNEQENTWVNFLEETKGKLFYKEKNVLKIAVEIFPEYWITAVVDKEK